MKKPLKEFTEEELSAAFGTDLSEEERDQLIAAEGDSIFDPAEEAAFHSNLRQSGQAVQTQVAEAVPALPPSVKAEMEQAMQAALTEKAAADAAFQKQAEAAYQPPVPKTVPKEKKFNFSALLGLAGACAALAIGAYWYVNFTGQSGAGMTMAKSARILTPGPVTGFSDPVFTWQAENGGAVDIRILDKGKVVAGIETVFSPIALDKLGTGLNLEPGKAYTFQVLSPEKILAEKSFAISEDAAVGGPVREPTLEGVIRQCENYIAQNRPADAWMLWSKLTDPEKQDERMKALKERIMALIG